jgi:hypothetical protein
MKTTITCPECGNEHQLYYHIDTKGRNITLQFSLLQLNGAEGQNAP